MRGTGRKDDIVERAGELIAQRGYDQMNLRDLAESMQISKGTILHHFGSKERLLEHVHRAYMRKRLAEARAILEATDSAPERLAALIYQLMIVQRTDRSATVAFAREIVRFSSNDLMADVRRMREEYTGIVRDVLEQGMREGQFRRDDASLLTLMIFGMCNWSWTWYRPEGRQSPEQIAALFTRSVLHGLARDDRVEVTERRIARLVNDVLHDVASRGLANPA